MDIRTDVKQRVQHTGHTVADVARALDVRYNTLSAWLNGYAYMPPDIESRLDQVVCGWERDKQVQPEQGTVA